MYGIRSLLPLFPNHTKLQLISVDGLYTAQNSPHSDRWQGLIHAVAIKSNQRKDYPNFSPLNFLLSSVNHSKRLIIDIPIGIYLYHLLKIIGIYSFTL